MLSIFHLGIARQLRLRSLPTLICIFVALFLETWWHVSSGKVQRPAVSVDAPFNRGCVVPDVAAPRENATFVMLARNEDIDGVIEAISSIETQFNHWFHYPMVFINDNPWDDDFVKRVKDVASGNTTFTRAPSWGFPDFIDQSLARASIQEQGRHKNLPYAGKESYHHMCRFYSGQFYDVPALQSYRYFWRIEPGVHFACAIPFDPFRAMRENKKRYGYAIALWEIGATSPTLLRAASDYKAKFRSWAKTSEMWKAMVEPSSMPWPIRKMLSLLPHRTAEGDLWNHCHYWSNFEIADLDLFRSKEYRHFFNHLDRAGGFYFERWGDAPVHSFAAALFLEPREMHRFEEIAYMHPPFGTCPGNAKGKQLWESDAFSNSASFTDGTWTEETEDGLGCRCVCPYARPSTFRPVCLNQLDKALRSA